ncbi:XVIPCD domain-containing protein, partial [Stenotrophomonas cyclobalanopsidis]|uniref:XVIPCD domain-containing protein n=1 Tax=Stenotrophomonas cyclobalanopsidis TaxID=2771362 RepID=UPI002FDAB8C9
VGNPLYTDALRGVHAQDARVGRTPDAGSERLAGSLAAEMHAAGGQRIDEVVMSNDASRSFAVQGQGGDPGHLRVSVDTAAAMNTPLEQSSQRVEQLAAQQRQVQARDAQLEQSQQHARTLHA